MDIVFRALWLATQPPDIQGYSLIHIQLLRASDAKLESVTSKMASRFADLTRKKFHKYSNKLFPKYTKKVTKFGLEVLTGNCDISVWLEFIDETGEKVFCIWWRNSNILLVTLMRDRQGRHTFTRRIIIKRPNTTSCTWFASPSLVAWIVD